MTTDPFEARSAGAAALHGDCAIPRWAVLLASGNRQQFVCGKRNLPDGLCGCVRAKGATFQLTFSQFAPLGPRGTFQPPTTHSTQRVFQLIISTTNLEFDKEWCEESIQKQPLRHSRSRSSPNLLSSACFADSSPSRDFLHLQVATAGYPR